MNSFQAWSEVYKKYNDQKEGFLWPNETLIRLMKGNYIQKFNKDYNRKKILDIGFGNGNNLLFFNTLGLELYGTEVQEDICKLVKEKLKNLGIETNLSVGTNRNLPYQENYFDYIASWNVIHYENNEEDIIKAIKEYHRVLKPGGRFFISTTGPEHLIKRDSKYLGNNRYLIGKKDDFRKGEIFFYFDTEENIKYYFSQFFKDISIGRTYDLLMSEKLDSFIISGIKE